MAVGPVKARSFWQQLEGQNGETESFKRGTLLRSSYSSDFKLQPRPAVQSIYCTIRDRKGKRSTSAPANRATITTLPTVNTISNNSQHKFRRMEVKARSENELTLPTKNLDYRAPKRYETTCYFKPLAVPVWYSTSVTLKTNSTKKKFTESVTYKNKLVPYRYVEKMSTMTSLPPKYVSNLEIHREKPTEHFISFEAQQQAALNKPFVSDHSLIVDNYS